MCVRAWLTLAAQPLPDWAEKLRASFDDPDLCYDEGESSRAAMARGVAAVEQALEGADSPLAVVSHGNLMTLLLQHFDNRFGFETWRALTNPDVLEVSYEDGIAQATRVWNEEVHPYAAAGPSSPSKPPPSSSSPGPSPRPRSAP